MQFSDFSMYTHCTCTQHAQRTQTPKTDLLRLRERSSCHDKYAKQTNDMRKNEDVLCLAEH